jgi:peptidoglycan/LPS O-acetylase OafA/YrhL
LYDYGYAVIFLTALVLSTIAAALSYQLIERPFLKLRRPWAPGADTRSPEISVALAEVKA